MQKLNTVFEWCNDIKAMRRFYTELLGLEETFYDEERGWLNHQVGETLLVFIRSPDALPVTSEWAKTPAYDGGTAHLSSWVLEVSRQDFDDVVKRLRYEGVPEWGDPEESPGGRAFFVRDPMGKTVEVFLTEDTGA